MSEIPGDLKYAKSHEWVRREDDGRITIGITDHAQEELGDLVYVELPELERELTATEDMAVVESVKAASDLYSPVTGRVVEVNQALADTPELINSDPYGEGWILRLQPAADADFEALLDSEAYEAVAAAGDG